MAFDFKKDCRSLYAPGKTAEIIKVPGANYIAIRGQGNPNTPDGAYQRAIPVLYAIAYTLKMSPKAGYVMDGFFEYVVPPLEGLWWQNEAGMDYGKKDAFHWISLLRLPDFVTQADFQWAVETAAKKKKISCSNAEFFHLEEGLCVQILHTGSFDTEPETVAKMDAFLQANAYENDFESGRMHHEIYLSDPRKTIEEKRKTIIRHPVRRK